MMKIEKDVPIPTDGTRLTAQGYTQTFREMEIGDSVVMDFALQSSIYSCSKLAGIKITTRKINNTQMRVWRIA